MSGEHDMSVGESFNDDAGGDSNSILSDLGGGASAHGGFQAPKAASKFSMQTIVIAGVLLVSGGMLYWMRAEATKAGVMTWVEPPIDYIDQQKPKRTEKEQEQILAGLNPTEIPAEVTEVDGVNPFRLQADVAGDTARTPVEDDAYKAQQLALKIEREHNQAIQKAIMSLQLQSVMTGRVPLARISGQMARVGDKVGAFFTVQTIGRSDVELIDDRGASHVLTMADDN